MNHGRHEASTQTSSHSTHRLTSRTVTSVHVDISCGAQRVKAISLNCFLDGGESALSRLVGRGGAVRSTGDIGRASLWTGKEVVRLLAVLVDQRGSD